MQGLRAFGRGFALAALGGAVLDERGIPSWFTLTRGAGGYSYQDRAAASGVTFIQTGSTQNAPRFHYLAALARRGLLIEPTRTNLNPISNFVDATNNEIPDGWTVGSGAQVTDWTCDTGGPHGGLVWHRVQTANNPVCQVAATIADPGTYIASAWVRATGLGASKTLLAYGRSGVWFEGVPLTAGTYDWRRQYSVAAATPGTAGDIAYISQLGDPGGTFDAALFQVEAGLYSSTWVPTTAGAAARAAELCAIASSVVPAAAGSVSFLWCPLWSNTQVTGTACLFAWGANDRIEFEGTGDTIRVINNSQTRAASAALTFARESLHKIRVDYGAFGTRLWVDSVLTSDSNAWVAPTVAAFLGSRAASAACESAVYADILLAA